MMRCTTTRKLWQILSAGIFMALAITPAMSNAFELPPRFYLKTLVGANFIPVLGLSTTGNVNPLDPTLEMVDPNVTIDANIVMAGYSKSFPLFGRAASLAWLQPMGDISVNGSGPIPDSSTSGFGDPFFEFDVNLLGPGPQYNLADALRYEPGLSIDLILDLSVPLGEYDNDEMVNIGQNRFWGRIGLPIIYQIGDTWAPSHRTTLEILPAVMIFADNDDSNSAGDTKSTDPGFTIGGHLTHDVSQAIWISLDASYYNFGDSKVNGRTINGKDFISVGAAIGTNLTNNLQFTVGYHSTINDNGKNDIELGTFSASLVYYWADILDGIERRKEAEHH